MNQTLQFMYHAQKGKKIVSKYKYIQYIYYTVSVFHIEINHFMIHIQISNETMYSIQNILSFAYREIFPSFCTIQTRVLLSNDRRVKICVKSGT